MIYRALATILVTSTLLFASNAFAQEDPSGDDASGETAAQPEIRYKAKTEIDFGDRKVSGSIRGPMGVYSESLRDQTFNPLVLLKKDFDREMVESVHSVR